MFGGGARPRTVDLDQIIRGASVRGHLRFWWRLLYARRYASTNELFEAEAAIFGSTEKAGAVSLVVRVTRTGELVDYEATPPERKLAYALFSFQPTSRGEVWAKGRLGVRFTVEVDPGSAPTPEVASALRLWATFGGIGARTRRGCGALRVHTSNLPGPEAAPALKKQGRVDKVTHLPGGMYLGRPDQDAQRAWAHAVETYREFRQAEAVARHPGHNSRRPGRSFYPEADTIRRWSGDHAPQHAPTNPVDGFPRADLGLPIVFHFKDEREGDPGDHIVQGPPGHARFASPVITKAVHTPAGYRPMIMVLDAPPVWSVDVTLSGGGGHLPIPQERIQLNDAELAQISPLRNQPLGKPIRGALISYVKGRGFSAAPITEVLS